jgi:hypothetical protein
MAKNHLAVFYSCRAWNGTTPISNILKLNPDFILENGDQFYNDYPSGSINGYQPTNLAIDQTNKAIGSTVQDSLNRYLWQFGPNTAWRTDQDLWNARAAGKFKRYQIRDDHDFLANNFDHSVEWLVQALLTLGSINNTTPTYTATNANPCVFTTPSNHGFAVGQPIMFPTNGPQPGGFQSGIFYYVQSVPTATTFTLSATKGGAVLGSTSTGAGSLNAYWTVNSFTATAVASPGVFLMPDHQLAAGQYVYIPTGSNLATGLTANTVYKVSATGLTRDQFQLFLADGVTQVNVTGAIGQVMTLYCIPVYPIVPTTQSDALWLWRNRQQCIAAVNGVYDDNPAPGGANYGVAGGDIPKIMQGLATAGDYPSMFWYQDRGADGTIGGTCYRYLFLDCISQKSPQHTCEIATFTVSIASPAVFTISTTGQYDPRSAMALRPGDSFTATTTGALQTGLVAGTTYYVLSAGYNPSDLVNNGFGPCNFQVSLTPGGAAVNTSGTQSGTHTLTNPNKTMLGAQQLAAVKAAALDAKNKGFNHVIVVSSKDYGQVDNGDAWVNYQTELKAMLTYFQVNNIPTIHVTGDRHHPHGGAFEVSNGYPYDAWFMQACPCGQQVGPLTQYTSNKFTASRNEYSANIVTITAAPDISSTVMSMISLWDMSVTASWTFPWGSRIPSNQVYMTPRPAPLQNGSATVTPTVTASPFVYKNTTGRNCVVNIAANGATITAVAAGALTGSLDVLATTSSQVTLRANDYLSVTYTGGPPILKVYPITR